MKTEVTTDEPERGVEIVVHRRARASTTMDRRYVQRPRKRVKVGVDVMRPAAEPVAVQVVMPEAVNVKRVGRTDVGAVMNALEAAADAPEVVNAPEMEMPVRPPAMRLRPERVPKTKAKRVTAKEIKDREIEKAVASAKRATRKRRKEPRLAAHRSTGLGWQRIMLAMVCSAVAVFAIAYFVNLSAPNVSLKVAAMQTGIEATYPGYIPRDYSLSDITAEDGKVTLNFRNNSSGEAYSIVEEKSSWDSTALLNNFVKLEYSDSYAVVKEQGLTLYMDSNAVCWVNGGVLYKLKVTKGSLTKKQLRTIAVSL